jgi:hypothetical protein
MKVILNLEDWRAEAYIDLLKKLKLKIGDDTGYCGPDGFDYLQQTIDAIGQAQKHSDILELDEDFSSTFVEAMMKVPSE